MAKAPSHFTVLYKGESILFAPLWAGEVFKGYSYVHPGTGISKCALNWIDTESGERHAITFDAAGRATIQGSLRCPQCGKWHVIVTNGVAEDA